MDKFNVIPSRGKSASDWINGTYLWMLAHSSYIQAGAHTIKAAFNSFIFYSLQLPIYRLTINNYQKKSETA